MKVESRSVEMEWLGGHFRYVKHPESGVMEIWRLEHQGTWKVNVWVKLYAGHVDPIRGAVMFYDEQL